MFGKKKTADPLDISTVAGAGAGTRTVNNVPLCIGGAALACFLGIVGYVMNERAQSSTYSSEEKTEKPSANAVKFADEMTADWDKKGIIAPKGEEVETPPPPPIVAEVEIPPLPDLPDMRPPVVDPYFNEREQLRTMRMQAYQKALNSQTNVGATMPPSQNIDQKIASSQQQLAILGDPASAYQAKLAAISSNTVEAPSQPSGTTEMTAQGTNARTSWTMPNSVEQHAPFTLQAGFVMPAIMISGITSNLAGQVMAQVSQDIYDSPSGQHLLIPKGTRLIGTYSNDVSYGQERVLMAWQRLVFPHGATLDIQSMPGADGAGNAGFNDEIDNHYFRIFGSAVLLSGIVAGVSLSQDNHDDEEGVESTLSESLGQNLGTTMAEMVRRNMDIAPTLHIRPGYRFNVMVTKDINFGTPYRGI